MSFPQPLLPAAKGIDPQSDEGACDGRGDEAGQNEPVGGVGVIGPEFDNGSSGHLSDRFGGLWAVGNRYPRNWREGSWSRRWLRFRGPRGRIKQYFQEGSFEN